MIGMFLALNFRISSVVPITGSGLATRSGLASGEAPFLLTSAAQGNAHAQMLGLADGQSSNSQTE